MMAGSIESDVFGDYILEQPLLLEEDCFVEPPKQLTCRIE